MTAFPLAVAVGLCEDVDLVVSGGGDFDGPGYTVVCSEPVFNRAKTASYEL
jgi:hypothetical protein